MIEKVLKELVKNQNYCVVETSEAIFEGFVTNVNDEAVEMYAFYATDDESSSESEDIEVSNSVISRVIFMLSNVEYIYPDHYIKVPVTDLQVRTLMKENLLKERLAPSSKKKPAKEKKTTTKNK